jgi:hypothetical protein
VHLLVAALVDYKAPPRRKAGANGPAKASGGMRGQPARVARRNMPLQSGAPLSREDLEDAPPVEEIMAMLGLRKT